jgi:23S rRNA pseudouridine1911/1915/1917 synthase
VETLFEVIYEDDEFLVINKPAGLVCHPTKTDVYSSLISRVRLYLGAGNNPQLINRLDRETSGVTCIAKREQVARVVRRLWENRQVSKEYLAIVHGHMEESHQVIVARLGKDEGSLVAIKDCVRVDGSEASTEIWRQGNFSWPVSPGEIQASVSGEKSQSFSHLMNNGWTDNPPLERQGMPHPSTKGFSVLKVIPHTGRKHQIRIHLAHIGHPVVGDKLYGESEDLYLALVENRMTPQQWKQLILPYHALHALKLRFAWGAEERVFRAEPEPWFKAFCSPIGIPA